MLKAEDGREKTENRRQVLKTEAEDRRPEIMTEESKSETGKLE